jgi:hypothetical protein
MDVIYVNTKTGDDTVTLAERIECEGYGIGVAEISGQLTPKQKIRNKREEEEEGKKEVCEENIFQTKFFYLCSNISEEVIINNLKLPILRKIHFNREGYVHEIYSKILLLRVEREPISKINLYITDEQGQRISFEGKGLNCTLVLIPPKKYKWAW